MSRTSTSLRRGLLRTAALGLAVLASTGVWLPAASAAPVVSVRLEPSYVEFAVRSTANSGSVPVDAPVGGSGFTEVGVAWGGSVTVTIPPQLTVGAPALAASLRLDAGDGLPTRTYSSGSSVPADLLVVTPLGGGQYRIDIPADDGTNGPFGMLVLTNLSSAVPGVVYVDPATFALRMSAGGPASAALPIQIVASSALPCPVNSSSCPGVVAEASPGSTLEVTLPSGGLIGGLGIPDLSSSAFAVLALDANGYYSGGGVTKLSARISGDRRTATLTLPTGLAPGRYELSVVLGGGSGTVISQTSAYLSVVKAANVGLRSNTGWGEDAAGTDDGSSPLVPLGAGMVLVAGAASVVVLRGRTSPQR